MRAAEKLAVHPVEPPVEMAWWLAYLVLRRIPVSSVLPPPPKNDRVDSRQLGQTCDISIATLRVAAVLPLFSLASSEVAIVS